MSTFNPKVDVFMPLYIGRYLQDTTHLDALKSGALLHLLMHIWVRGPLPNDPIALATIAKCTPDAWSMCQASVMQYLFLGDDGMLHQRGAERLKAEWMDKRLKAHEKAQKAANARWSEHRAKKQREIEQSAKNNDAPSIAQELLEQCPTSSYEEQKQKPDLTPTPSAPRMGMQIEPDASSISPRRAGRSPRQLGNAPRQVGTSPTQLGRSPRQLGKSPRQLGQSPRQLGSSPRQNESKAKPQKPPARAAGNATNGTQPYPSASDRRATPQRLSAGHSGNAGNPANGDFRARGFEDEVLRFWRGQNPEHPEYAFSGPDRRALRELLEHHRELTLEEFRRLLANRAASSINPSALPHKWLRSILEFSAGPLRKFGKPAAVARAL